MDFLGFAIGLGLTLIVTALAVRDALAELREQRDDAWNELDLASRDLKDWLDSLPPV